MGPSRGVGGPSAYRGALSGGSGRSATQPAPKSGKQAARCVSAN
jgi:hypothetical protein